MCVCVCVRERERERERGGDGPIQFPSPSPSPLHGVHHSPREEQQQQQQQWRFFFVFFLVLAPSPPRRRHPLPGRGHIHPMLALARRLASRGLLVTLLLTPEWLRLLSPTTTTTNPNPNPSSIDGDEGLLLRLRAIPGAALPSESARGAAYAAFARAVLADMAAPAEAAATAAGVEGPAVDLVVADALLPWAPAIARRRGVPAAALFPQSASVLRALLAFGDGDGDGDATHKLCDQEEKLQALKYNPRASSPHLPDFTTLCFGQSMHTTFLNIISWLPTAHSLLLNSLHELEPHALASLSSILPLPLHPIAPSFPHLPTNTTTNNNYDASPQPHYFQWLNSHPPNSILYVSLGSFLPLSKEEVKELALGLKLSGHPFLWSMRTEEEDDDVGGVAGVGEKGWWCRGASSRECSATLRSGAS
uniref:Uncharacterized protein n=1 Tax=Ananas comosus var. bracteatus TaxID=296719 RepID=A0A6V7PSI8_ANACO|nr:unnamed protein product [Ananas comosus var. bracteatus]